MGAVLLLLSFAPTASAQPAETPPGVQVITAEEITQAGLARLSDLFLLINDWHATSVAGYSWEASANGLASAGEAAWLLVVDGNPVDLRVLDTQNINTLPLSISEIDYVEVHNTPTFIAGLFARAGVLHLHTRTPEAGVTVQADVAAGNEVGDPGPFRYTRFATPNIDRIGPTLQGAASVARDAWHLRVHGKVDEHHASDERIRPRVLTFYQGEKQPRLLLASGGLDLSATGRLGRHNVFAGVSRFQDLPFFEVVGLDTPTDHRFIHAGARGDFAPGQPTGVSYRLSFTSSALETRNNRGRVHFDWRQRTLRGQYEVRTASARLRGALGLSVDYRQTTTGADLANETLTVPRAYGRFGYRPDARLDAHLRASLTRVRGQMGYTALATVRFTPTAIHTVTLTGSLARQPFEATNSLWYWLGEGYTFSALRDYRLALPTSYGASTTYTADLVWRIRPSNRFSLALHGGLRRFDDHTLPVYAFRYDSLSTGFFAETRVSNNVFGRVTRIGGEVSFRLLPTLRQQLHYAYVRYPTQDDVFFQAWRSQPWHRFSYTVRYLPNSRVSLYGRLSYRSETQWTAFLEAARDAGGRYEANLPGYWMLDLAAQKRFWRDHLRLSVSLRNVLNEAYRTHPAGAITSMAFHVRLQVYLNAGGAR